MGALTTIDKALKSAAPRYRHVAGDGLHWAQERQHAVARIRANKDLRAATEESLTAAVLQAGSMGLTLNPVRDHCYLIPRKARRNDPNAPIIAYASPSYKGLSWLAQEAGDVRWMRAEVVFKADRFRYLGPAERPRHEPTLDSRQRREADAIGVYAMAKTADGDVLTEFVDRETVQKIRRMSEVPNSTMWSPDKLWTEGWKKAAIRRLFKTLPSSHSAHIQAAQEQLNRYEGAAAFEDVPEPPPDEGGTLCLSDDQFADLDTLIRDTGISRQVVLDAYGVQRLEDLPAVQYESCRARLIAYQEQKKGATP